MRFGVVSDVRVADGEIAVSFAFVISLALVTTPWLIDGPIIAMTFAFEMNRCVAVRDLAASSCESPWTILNRVPFCLLYWETPNCAQLSCSCPRKPAGPVSGAFTPSETFVQRASCAAAAEPDVFATAAVTTTVPTSTANATAIAALLICPPLGVSLGTKTGLRSLRARPRGGITPGSTCHVNERVGRSGLEVELLPGLPPGVRPRHDGALADALDAVPEAQTVGLAGVLELGAHLAGTPGVVGRHGLQVCKRRASALLDELAGTHRWDHPRRLGPEAGLDRDGRELVAEQRRALAAGRLVTSDQKDRAAPRAAERGVDARLAHERVVEPEILVVAPRDRVVHDAVRRAGARM